MTDSQELNIVIMPNGFIQPEWTDTKRAGKRNRQVAAGRNIQAFPWRHGFVASVPGVLR